MKKPLHTASEEEEEHKEEFRIQHMDQEHHEDENDGYCNGNSLNFHHGQRQSQNEQYDNDDDDDHSHSRTSKRAPPPSFRSATISRPRKQKRRWLHTTSIYLGLFLAVNVYAIFFAHYFSRSVMSSSNSNSSSDAPPEPNLNLLLLASVLPQRRDTENDDAGSTAARSGEEDGGGHTTEQQLPNSESSDLKQRNAESGGDNYEKNNNNNDDDDQFREDPIIAQAKAQLHDYKEAIRNRKQFLLYSDESAAAMNQKSWVVKAAQSKSNQERLASMSTRTYKTKQQKKTNTLSQAGGTLAAAIHNITNGKRKFGSNKDDNDEIIVYPYQPLCDLCLRVVQSATPVDLTYVPVAGNFSEHPHKGATDSQGRLGYIHDAKRWKRRYSFELRARQSLLGRRRRQVILQKCSLRDNHYKMIHGKIRVVNETQLEQQRTDLFEKTGYHQFQKPVRLFCAVYTTRKGHLSRITKIRSTWGPSCDGFLAASTFTNPEFATVNLPHEGPETYDNIWQKVRSIWAYIYDHYYDDYDWFHIGGDDLFLMVENLRYYLESEEIATAQNGGTYLVPSQLRDNNMQTPLFLGCRHKRRGHRKDIYNGGGPGYTINKAALKRLVVDGLPKYYVHTNTSAEDVMISYVFRELGIFPYETKDETGAERYNALTPGMHYLFQPPQDTGGPKNWFAMYIIDGKKGLDHCSTHSITFHYVQGPFFMNRLFVMLYGLCPPETLVERKKQEIGDGGGGGSGGAKNENDTETSSGEGEENLGDGEGEGDAEFESDNDLENMNEIPNLISD